MILELFKTNLVTCQQNIKFMICGLKMAFFNKKTHRIIGFTLLCLLTSFVIVSALNKKLIYSKLNPKYGTDFKEIQMCSAKLSLANVTCVQNGNWNNPAIWSTGIVPNSTDDVTIPAGFNVLIDGNVIARKITIEGSLKPLTNSINFTIETRGIMVMGSNALFEIGSPVLPYTGKCSITLIGNNSSEVLFTGMGTKVLGSMNGGTIRLEGIDKKSWTQLGTDAAVGATQITLKEVVGWQVGDEILVVSSRANWNEAEKRTVTAISNGNKTFNFSTALAYPHTGSTYTHTRSTDNKTWTADLRAEVGLLTHNIKIQGDTDSDISGFGGHIMAHQTGKLFIGHVELFRMGQKSRQGRYPIHWHMLHTDGNGQYLKSSSIHKSFNRAITIHGTHGTLIDNNFFYDHIGHGVFLENGSEINNTISNNVVLLSKRPAVGEQLTPSDNSDDVPQNRTPSSFWITNPNNNFIGNVAAGTQGSGFWYALAQQFLNESLTDSRFAGQTLPYKEVFGGFSNNKAHSCMNGMDLFDRVDANHAIIPNENWEENNIKKFTNNLWYANDIAIYTGSGNGQSRLWTSKVVFENDVFVENRFATMFASYSTVTQSLFVANSGQNLISGERYFLRLYDGPATISNSHLVGWNSSNANLYANFGAAIKKQNTTFDNITFDTPNPVRGISEDYRNSITSVGQFTNQGGIFDISFYDKTGSFSGNVNSTIVGNHPMLLVGDETNPKNWTNLYSTPRKYVTAYLEYPTTTPVNIGMSRTKSGTPTANIYDTYMNRNQLALITNDDFLYTYQFEQLPTSKTMVYKFDNGFIGDVTISRFKDFGKLGGLSITSSGAFTNQVSLAALKASSNAGYFVEPNGDLYLKSVLLGPIPDRTYSIQWTTNYTTYPADTDGDGVDNPTEFSLGRNPNTPSDLSFKYNTTTDGWTSGGTIANSCVACNSSWEISTTGNSSYINRNGLNFDANQVTNIYADVKSTVSGNFRFYWTTEDDNTFTEDKSVLVPYSHFNQRGLLNFPLGGHPKWTNKTIKQLRLNLIEATGFTSIYNIYANKSRDSDGDRVSDIDELSMCRDYLSAKDLGINFDLPNEVASTIQTEQISNLQTVNGILSGTASGADPKLVLNSLNFKGVDVPKIKIRIKSTNASIAEMFWINEDGGYSGQRIATASITSANTWQEIVFDMSNNPNWVGKTISSLRIDPIRDVVNQSFEIDWIRSSTYQDCSTACRPLSVALPYTTANGWTYYALPSSTDYLFAIEHKPLNGNTADFTASVTISKACELTNNYYSVSNTNTKEGTFAAGAYWNVKIESGSPNGFVNYRFFPSQSHNIEMENIATSFASVNNITHRSASTYFNSYQSLNLSTDLRSDGRGLKFGMYPLQINSVGSFGDKNYVQFNNIIQLPQIGGGLLRRVTQTGSSVSSSPELIKGTIRYNSRLDKFEGFNGVNWVSLH